MGNSLFMVNCNTEIKIEIWRIKVFLKYLFTEILWDLVFWKDDMRYYVRWSCWYGKECNKTNKLFLKAITKCMNQECILAISDLSWWQTDSPWHDCESEVIKTASGKYKHKQNWSECSGFGNYTPNCWRLSWVSDDMVYSQIHAAHRTV